jgi:hypothetical protein
MKRFTVRLPLTASQEMPHGLDPRAHRVLAAIHTWQDGHGQPGGRAEAAPRLDEAHKLLDEVANVLTEMRRTLLGGGNRSQ